MKIMGIDPSLHEAAAATLETSDARPDLGVLVGGWRVQVEGTNAVERAFSLVDQLYALIGKEKPDVLTIETPADAKVKWSGAYLGRSPIVAAMYGVGVGAVLLGLRPLGIRTIYAGVNEWTSRDVPSTGGDKHKTKRVGYAAALYGRTVESFGPKTYAGNIADAIFIARWGLWRTKAPLDAH